MDCLANIDMCQDYLCQIIDILTCRLCDRFLQNPIGLKCNHRFCERCVNRQFTKENLVCIQCQTVFSKSSLKQQSQLKMYIGNFKKLIELLKNTGQSQVINSLYDFVFMDQDVSKTPILNKENNGPKTKELSLKNKLNEIDDLTFAPDLYSTAIKKRNSGKQLFAAEDSLILAKDKTTIVEETVCNINETVCGKENGAVAESPIKNVRYLKDATNSSSDIYNQSTLDDFELPLNINEDFEDQLQNQQLDVKLNKRQPVTYSRKGVDKFDRVFNMTNEKLSKKAETQVLQTGKVSQPTSEVSTRSRSPELFSLSDSDDDELISSIF